MGKKKSERKRTLALRQPTQRKLDAKRRATTLAGRAPATIGPTPELLLKRLVIAGDKEKSLDLSLDLPLEILLAHGLISEEMRDEGLRFAQLAWALFGHPNASCEALYRRMVAEGAGSDFTPRLPGEAGDEAAEEREKRQRGEYERMVRAMHRTAGAFEAVREVAQYLRLPRFVLDHILKRPSRSDVFDELKVLVEGLRILVKLKDRQKVTPLNSPNKAVQPAAIATAVERAERQWARAWGDRCAAWFDETAWRAGQL